MKKLIYLSCFLAVVGALSALLLTVVNNQTKGIIQESANERQRQNLGQMFPGNVDFEPVALVGNPTTIREIVAVNENGATKAYAFTIETNGYGGAFRFIVGVNIDGTYTGFSVLNHSETPGFGAAMTEPKFTEQFPGTSIEAGIDGVSGATRTTNAIFLGLDEVVAYFEANLK